MNAIQPKQFILFFDGATAEGNPGVGGCGAVCWDKDNRNDEVEEPFFCERRTLGTVTDNVAEYYGLIIGLRRLLHEYPITSFDVIIKGDSELVIKQLKGEYEVRASNLRILHIIAWGLIKRIKGKVGLKHVERSHNKPSDKLAKKASKESVQEGQFLVFYPNRMGLLGGTMNGRQLTVGNDCGTAARTPEVLFDATTILEILGKGALETLLDPGKTTRVNGQVDFTILGILREPVTFTVQFANGPIELTIDDAVVVDFLPYDVQLSVDHPGVRNMGWSLSSNSEVMRAFEVSNVPTRFQSHPFWCDDSIFFAGGYGIGGL